jgi:hypothetical protein
MKNVKAALACVGLACVGLACVGLGAIAGCSAAPTPAASPQPASTTTVQAAATSTAPTAPATGPASTPAPSPSAQAPGGGSASPVPTLGQPAGVFVQGEGFGQVKPSKIFNGGDPTGLVTHVAWSSWGGAQAEATGISEYVGPNQSVAQGSEQTATVVAFNLGACDGKLMYQAVEWYFPQHGQTFNPDMYENICTGSYVPGS